ncbi:hypothetical protein L0V05_02990 [Tabrizicola sp. J26]|uniref:hypothetical protein n=1 Tax=Alitabrizicola rongguiensis TaxID=2909234 RepID=UPI001F21F7C0|nr:hypothetical protein [Tabrizicola rongguiensis]MCF1707776.1 hypothetical protein [Tabrizicola rongguiensis]
MTVLIGVMAGVFALWLVLLLRAGVRLLLRAQVTRGDVRLLVVLTVLMVALCGGYWIVLSRLV